MSEMTSYHHDGAGPLPRRSVLGLLGSVPVAGAVAVTGRSAQASPAAGCGRPPAPPPRALLPGGAFDHMLARLTAQDQFSGTVLLTCRDRPVLARAYGMADKEKGIPNRVDTIFALASVTKLFTAAAVIQLAGQGKVELYQTLGTYLDGFPAQIAGTVTVHQLLTHTSGMGNFLGDPGFLNEESTWTSAAETTGGIMAIIRQSPLLFTPGTQYSYSNSGYATLGAIAAQVSGQSYYDYVREHIFARAGMTRSGFYTKPQWLTDPDIAHPYGTPGGKSNPQPGGPITDLTGEEDFIGNPAGNAFSTAPDMARFARALTGGGLLSPAWADLMTSGKVPYAPQRNRPPSQLDMVGYGPEIRVVNDQIIFGHTGGADGETTDIGIYPGLDWVTVMLSNYTITSQMESILPWLDQLITQHGGPRAT
jgi:CubicO group peptidase (beta-lactamase class C family)